MTRTCRSSCYSRPPDAPTVHLHAIGRELARLDSIRWLPSAFVQAVAYRGTSPVPEGPRDMYQVDAQDITGPADEQVLGACRFAGWPRAVTRPGLPQIRTCAIDASGSSNHGFAA